MTDDEVEVEFIALATDPVAVGELEDWADLSVAMARDWHDTGVRYDLDDVIAAAGIDLADLED